VQVTFQAENAPAPRWLAPGLREEVAALPTGAAKFDLSLTLLEEPDSGIYAELGYATDLFFATTARRLLAQFATLLAGALGPPAARLSELPLLAAAERQQLLWEWGGSPALAAPEGITGRIARQVRRAADAVAVVDGERQLSYGELARRAGALARRLAARGV